MFSDLEIQLQQELDTEIDNRVLEEERQRQSRLFMRDRIQSLGRSVPQNNLRIRLKSGDDLVVAHTRVGKDWWAVQILEPQELAGEALISLCSITLLHLQSGQLHESLGTPVGHITDHELLLFNSAPRVLERVTYPFVLRDLARRRKNVRVLTSKERWHGIIDRVGADHVEVSMNSGSKVIFSSAEIHCVVVN